MMFSGCVGLTKRGAHISLGFPSAKNLSARFLDTGIMRTLTVYAKRYPYTNVGRHLARACAKRSQSAPSPYMPCVFGRFKFLELCSRGRFVRITVARALRFFWQR